MINFKPNKIVLQDHKPPANPTSEEMAKIVMSRIGLDPRKSGSTDRMHQTMLELYERAKIAHREKKPEEAVMTVEEMGMYAGITRQTMYDYLRRWLHLNMIVKTSYIKDNKVIIGYKLNGITLEGAFEKAMSMINNHLKTTKEQINKLQKLIKNEKIAQSQRRTPIKEPAREEEEKEKTEENIKTKKEETEQPRAETEGEEKQETQSYD